MKENKKTEPVENEIVGKPIPDSYVFSEPERKLLGELDAAADAALQPLNLQRQAILALIFRQQGLAGNYRISEDRTKLIKAED